jgi:hypothetical protein
LVTGVGVTTLTGPLDGVVTNQKVDSPDDIAKTDPADILITTADHAAATGDQCFHHLSSATVENIK